MEQSHLPAKRTLDTLGVPRTTFYRWYNKYLPQSMMRPADLVAAGLARLDHVAALFGPIEIVGITELSPVWRPLVHAIARRVPLRWNAGPRPVPDWLDGETVEIVRDETKSPDISAVSAATAYHEAVEAMRWARELLASGRAEPADIAIASATPGEYDDHLLALGCDNAGRRDENDHRHRAEEQRDHVNGCDPRLQPDGPQLLLGAVYLKGRRSGHAGIPLTYDDGMIALFTDLAEPRSQRKSPVPISPPRAGLKVVLVLSVLKSKSGRYCNSSPSSARTFWRNTSIATLVPFMSICQKVQPLHAGAPWTAAPT